MPRKNQASPGPTDRRRQRDSAHGHWLAANFRTNCSTSFGESLESGPLQRIVQNPASRLAGLIETYEDTRPSALDRAVSVALSCSTCSEHCYRFYEYRAGRRPRVLEWSRTGCCHALHANESITLVERETQRRIEWDSKAQLIESVLEPTAAKRATRPTYSAPCIAAASDTSSMSQTLAADSNKTIKLHPRDRRLFIPAYRTEPTIRVREGMVVVALHRHLCVVLQPQRMLVQDFHCHHARALQKMIWVALSENQAEGTDTFLLRAVEAALGVAVRLNERKLARIESEIKHSERHAGMRVEKAAIQHMQGLARQLALIVVRARMLQMALEQSLEEGIDQELAGWIQAPTRDRSCRNHADASLVEARIETMIERLIHQSHQHGRTAAALRQRLQGVEEATFMELTVRQIRLWTLNVLAHLWLATMMVTLIPADFFGMNVALPAFELSSLNWPWFVVFVISFLLGAAFLSLGLCYLQRRGLLRILFTGKTKATKCSVCEMRGGATISWNTLTSITGADCC
jgi:hypothetical protein